MIGRRRGPGLINTMARTAVIAGTARAVSDATGNKMAAQAQAQAAQEQLAAQQQQAQVDAAVARALEDRTAQAVEAAPPAPAQEAPAAPAASAMSAQERIAALQQLAELHSLGVLTEAELASEKARILAG